MCSTFFGTGIERATDRPTERKRRKKRKKGNVNECEILQYNWFTILTSEVSFVPCRYQPSSQGGKVVILSAFFGIIRQVNMGYWQEFMK